MRLQRVFVNDYSFCSIFYYCPKCGSEVLDYDNRKSFFKKPADKDTLNAMFGDYVGPTVNPWAFMENKKRQVCPTCGKPVAFDIKGCYLDVSKSRIRWEGKSTDHRRQDDFYPNYFGFYFNDTTYDIELYHSSDTDRFSDEIWSHLKGIRIVGKKDEKEITKAFSILKQIRIKAEEQKIETAIAKTISEGEAKPLDTISVDIDKIKKDPELLKKYIEHLINIESSIYATKIRLEDLLKFQVSIQEETVAARYSAAEKQRKAVESAERTIARLPSKDSYKEKAPPAPVAPQKPVEPPKPELHKAGLFNKRKVQKENESLTSAYEHNYRAYEEQLAAYEIACDKYKLAVQAHKKALLEIEKEAERKYTDAREIATKKLEDAETALKDVLKNPPETDAAQVKKLIDAEIKKATETIKKLIKARNELYSVNVVFGKYRNLVALTSFYEYLLSGRCETLEGRDGAYNIYESEIRANQIISQLNDVLHSLEEIKNGQFLVYSTIKDVYSSLEQLNKKTEVVLTAIQSDMNRLADRSEIIAYNTAQAAFYAKKNTELTNALGFLIALK